MELYLNFYPTDNLDQIFPDKSKDLYLTLYQHINGHAQSTYQEDLYRLFTRFAIYEVVDYDPATLEVQKKLLVDLFKPAINIKFRDKHGRADNHIYNL